MIRLDTTITKFLLSFLIKKKKIWYNSTCLSIPAFACFKNVYKIYLRAAIERRLVGLPELIPLNYSNFKQSLGPGYNTEYFRFQDLQDRKGDCLVKAKDVKITEGRRKSLESSPGSSVAEFMDNIYKSGYHERGHLDIGDSCGGPMPFAEASARDPIFWRWHKHIKDWTKRKLDEKVLPEG